MVSQIVDSFIKQHPKDQSSLIGVMLDVQNHFYYLPKESLFQISKELKVPISTVYNLATFYKAFSLKPKGKHPIAVCTGTACHVQGATKLLEKFERELKIFSRRAKFNYCQFYSGYNINGKMTREKQKYEYYNSHERNLCVNLTNENTVEIRLLRGTMDRTTIISGMELITVMVDMVLKAKTEEKVRLITWNDLKNAIPRDFVDLKAYLSKKNL